MAITFGPNSEKPAPANFGPQFTSLVNKIGDLTFRMESLEYKFKQVYLAVSDSLGRIRSLEQHYLWMKGTGPSIKKMATKMAPKSSFKPKKTSVKKAK